MRIALFLILFVLIVFACKKEAEELPPIQTTWKVCHTFDIVHCQYEDSILNVMGPHPIGNYTGPSDLSLAVIFENGDLWAVSGRPQPGGPPGQSEGDWKSYFEYNVLGDSLKICAEIPDNDSIRFYQYCNLWPTTSTWNGQAWLYVKGELVWDTIY